MQNVKNNSETYSLKVEKLIQRNPADVFRAIGEGRLFLNCGANDETLKIDFKVGGKYHIQFLTYGMFNQGEFLEVKPNEKIAFTWCQNASTSDIPDTVVTILLKEQDQNTLLTLTHTGFSDKENTDNHTQGWTGGLTDLNAEMAEGKLRFNRWFDIPVSKLYEICSQPATFLGKLGDLSQGQMDIQEGGIFQLPTPTGQVSGKFLELVPNQKIAFSWNSTCGGSPKDTKVTLNFETEEDDQSWIELIHEGLITETQQKSHHEGWNWLLNQLIDSK